MKSQSMPYINLEALEVILTPAEFDIARRIVNTKTGELRASKPKTADKIKVSAPDSFLGYDRVYATAEDRVQGEAAYVWRMVAFFISTKSQHHCMPCTADFDLDGSVRNQHTRAKELDQLVDKITNAVDPSKWHGVRRWGNAFGTIGTPQVAPDGSIIYR